MQDASLMGIGNSACQLDDEFRRVSGRHRFALGNFIESLAFHERHAEIAGTVAFPNLMNRNDARVVQTRCGLRLESKPFDMRFRGPPSETDDFQCHYAVKAFLSRPIDQALAAA